MIRELGFPQDYPNTVYKYNDTTIDIMNSSITTETTLHIGVQLFDIQGRKEYGDIIMNNIHGIINSTYYINKHLGWVLHYRHSRYLMGNYNISFRIVEKHLLAWLGHKWYL